MYGSNVVRYTNYQEANLNGMVLGKNLYGETGYVTPDYTIQQPFPGQTVYVPESPSKISNRTREKFSQPIMWFYLWLFSDLWH